MLLIIDDAFKADHALPFLVGGPKCSAIVTTRFPEVAANLASTPDDVYLLSVLTDEDSIQLLGLLCEPVVKAHPLESLDLVHALEGLPLALHVAGRLLHVESDLGFGVSDLIQTLRNETALLEAQAPKDRLDVKLGTIPTVAALLRKSTDLLEEHVRGQFAYLGAFAPKPATFDLDAMKAVWAVDDAKPAVRLLVNRGLLEPAQSGRFQMHALLVMHARTLLDEMTE